MCVCVCVCISHAGGVLVTKLCSTLTTQWTVMPLVPVSMRFPRQEYCRSQESNMQNLQRKNTRFGCVFSLSLFLILVDFVIH